MGEEIELTPGRIIAGRYQVLEQVGAAAFSRAVQVLDLKDDTLLCLKVVKVRVEVRGWLLAWEASVSRRKRLH